MGAGQQPGAFLQAFSEENRALILGSARRRNLRKREILFSEGQEGSHLYVLDRGRVQLYKLSAEGKEVSIRVIQPGELFGEVVLFEEQAYPVTASALSPSTVLEVPRRLFEALLERKGFRTDFIRILLRKERYLTDRIRALTVSAVEERFVAFLREHWGQAETITVTLAKRDVASSIGAAPETFSRMLARLREQGKIEWEGNTLRVAPELWRRVPLR